MTLRKKSLVGFASLCGVAIALAPLWLQFTRPAAQTRAERALRRYVEENRHHSVKNVRCIAEERSPGVYLCLFQYGGFNPLAIPKHLCLRLRADRAQPVACFTEPRPT